MKRAQSVKEELVAFHNDMYHVALCHGQCAVRRTCQLIM